MLTRILIALPLLAFPIITSAFEVALDQEQRYAEIGVGNADFGIDDNFYYENDNYDNSTALNFVLGMHFQREDRHVVALEGIFNFFGEVDASSNAGGVERSASVEALNYGAGLKFGRRVDDEILLYTRFGLHAWSTDGEATISSESVSGSEDGIDYYAGIGVNFKIGEYIHVKGDFNAYPVTLDGDDFHIKVFSLGAGYYF